MNGKLVVIISSSDPEKAQTGAMYGLNSLKNGWMAEVRIFLFGPAQKLLLKDSVLQGYMKEFQSMNQTPIACKFISDRDKNSDEIDKIGVKVEYVGKIISDLINEGYTPMVW